MYWDIFFYFNFFRLALREFSITLYIFRYNTAHLLQLKFLGTRRVQQHGLVSRVGENRNCEHH
jgi:hypothetical protein